MRNFRLQWAIDDTPMTKRDKQELFIPLMAVI